MKRITSLVVAILMVTSVLSGAVVAQSDTEDTSYFDQLREPGDQGSSGLLPGDIGTTAAKTVSSVFTAGNRYYERYVGGADSENATDYANDFQSSFNENNETLVTWVNERMTADSEHDVIAIEFTDTSGNTATRYLVTNVSNSTYQSAEIVESTDRNVSDTITADWYASRHASSELDTFVTDYAEPNTNVSDSYWVRMLGTYGGEISGTLWGDV